jgi:hypothetical protein
MSARLALLATLAVLGCGKKSGPTPKDCPSYTFTHQGGTNPHVDCASAQCGNGLNPPTAGPHCANILPCQKFTSAQLRCQWIHNLEHGHAVLAYNCPGGCADQVARLEQVYDSQPAGNNGVRRMLITPDPLLAPNTFAAIVWGWSWVGTEADPTAIGCLISRQDLEAPEAGLDCSP